MSRRTPTYCIALAALLALAAASPTSVVTDGPVKLSVHVDRETAQVAQPIRLVVEVDAPQGTRVQLPEFAENLGDFEVQNTESTKDLPTADAPNTRRWTVETNLETINTGELTVPAIDVHYTTDAKSSTFKTLQTKPITIRITSVLEDRADPTKFRDIKETVDVAVPQLHSYAWVKWAAIGVGSTITLALLALVAVKRRRGPSPAAWALAAIADLEKLPITNPAEAEAAYNEVVDVLREFFELEFNMPTLSRTTREFLAEATKIVRLDQTAHERLTALASIADEIKFARLGVGEPQVREAIAQAIAFIDECEAHRRALEKEAA
jgi:hypothetical protein